MKSVATGNFWKLYRALPESVRREAQKAFRIFRDNPAQPGLCLERLRSNADYYDGAT